MTPHSINALRSSRRREINSPGGLDHHSAAPAGREHTEHIFRGGRERGPERASGVQCQSAETISSNEHSPSVAMGSLTRCSGKTEAVITRCGSHEASPDRTVYPRSWHVHRRLNYARYRPPCRKNRLPGHSCSICRRGPKLGIEQQEGIRATS